MNKLSVLLATFLSIQMFSHADELAEMKTSDQDQTNPHHLFVDPDVFRQYFSYSESGGYYREKITVKSKATFFGVRCGYEFIKPDALYAGVDGIYATGTERNQIYPGGLFRQDRYSTSRTFFNTEGRAGYSFQLPQRLLFTPFLGLGWHHETLNNWSYIATGIRVNHTFNPDFDLGFNAKIMNMLTNKSFPRDIAMPWGYEFGMPCTWHTDKSQKWETQFQPYFLKLVANVNTYIVGARLLVAYRF